MTYKPWYRSVSIVGLLAGFAGSVANYFHANIADLVPVLNADLGNYLNDTVALAGVIGSIVARCREAHGVTLTKKSAAQKNAVTAPSVASVSIPGTEAGAIPAESSLPGQSTSTGEL